METFSRTHGFLCPRRTSRYPSCKGSLPLGSPLLFFRNQSSYFTYVRSVGASHVESSPLATLANVIMCHLLSVCPTPTLPGYCPS
jgi:hypothetical protein